jgi:hypothetical protein
MNALLVDRRFHVAHSELLTPLLRIVHRVISGFLSSKRA